MVTLFDLGDPHSEVNYQYDYKLNGMLFVYILTPVSLTISTSQYWSRISFAYLLQLKSQDETIITDCIF